MTKRELIELLEMSEIEDMDEILVGYDATGDGIEPYRLVAIDEKTNYLIVEPV